MDQEQIELTEIKVEFKHFDIIPTDEDNSITSDHHYFSSASTLSSPSFQKTIMKEWRILEGNLPDSIYVRVYEQRIDLLRAAIIGPAGTPYHDGLFFFDIQFPSNYPNAPPKVHYRSFGYRLNPNLYENGYVCLSLINTWSGAANEKWIPSQSTMLQVLVSIQALVLNAKPYFNEPAYANLPKNSDPWKTESLHYDENTFILSCKTMMCVLNAPPKFFEEFVVQHFRDRADAILSACKAYDTGRAQIGDQVTTTTAGKRITNKPSWTFKKSMENIYPKLVNSFAKSGPGSPNHEIQHTSRSSEGQGKYILLGSCLGLGIIIILFFLALYNPQP
ncbi:hypothetical protein MKW94_009643 [Papaver nudicaule]|uniref:UBC core domain-containing protein n=1 Tax=Papaver nudicaule TaxID=74823 RepID=A0AA41V647_PAPNU|nr:hypothetical protein [Papaver nudicaule]